MKQITQNLRTGETSIVDVPRPAAREGTALVEVMTSLVSAGTERMLVDFAEKSLVGKARSRPDLVKQVIDKARREGLLTSFEAAINRLDQPIPLGYSSAGKIIALGTGMEGFQIGQRVACAGGGYAVHAEYNVIPRNLLAVLPDNVDYESAAFTTLGAIALHGFHLAQPVVGEYTAVIGLGLLGLLTVAIANSAGCQVIGIDIDPVRVKLATQMGAKLAVLREEAEAAARSFTRGRGCDAVLICADTSTDDPVNLAGLIARDRAHIVAIGAVGQQLPRKIYYEKELTFINSRSYGPGRYDPTYEEEGVDYPLGYVRWTEGRNLEAFLDLVGAGRINVQPLITHRFPIEQAPKAYELITKKGTEPFLGVLLSYGEEKRAEDLIPDQHKKPASISKLSRPLASQSTRIALGVLGAGNFATNVMLPIIVKNEVTDRIGIASANGLNAQNANQRFRFQYATAEADKIFNDPQINAVAIFTRHHLHANQIMAALQAGKHVFCEKPLAIHQAELDDLSELLLNQVDGNGEKTSSHSHPILMVGFNRRFSPFGQQLKAFLIDRQEPVFASYRINAGPLPKNHWVYDPEQGGGRLVGEGCHFIDFLCYLIEQPLVSISAVNLPDQGIYQEDNVVLNLRFADGSISVIEYLANGDRSLPKERVEVFTGGRVAILDDFRTLQLTRDGRSKTFRSRLRQDKGHSAEWKAFAQALLVSKTPPIPYSQLIEVTKASFKAAESLRAQETLTLDSNSGEV